MESVIGSRIGGGGGIHMKKSKLYKIMFLLCIVLCGCGSKDPDKGEKVKDAAALCDRLGIDMSMAQQRDGVSDFTYSIVDETIGQVMFMHDDSEIRWLASKDHDVLERLGITISDDGAALGTTLDAGVDTDDSLTGISCVNLEAGGCVYGWNWHGIVFHMIVPWDVDMDYYEGRFVYGIAVASYVQPDLQAPR